MRPEQTVGRAICVERALRQDSKILQDRVLRHAAVAFGQEENVAERPRGILAQQAAVDAVENLHAGERRRHMERGDALRNVKDAPAVALAASRGGGAVESILHSMIVQS